MATLAFALAAKPALASDDGETIYSNRNRGGHIEVVKKELPPESSRPGPGRQRTPWAPGHGAGGHSAIRPGDRVAEYSFIMQSSDGKRSQVVGTKRIVIRGDEVERMLFTLFCIAELDDRVIVLYKCRNRSYVDVAMLGAHNTGFLMSDSPPLAVDLDDGQAMVIGMTIDDYVQGGVTLRVTRYDPKQPITERFHLASQNGEILLEPCGGKGRLSGRCRSTGKKD